MTPLAVKPFDLSRLRLAFGSRLQSDAPLDRYTAARLGGRADALLEVETRRELAEAARLAWQAWNGRQASPALWAGR
jgi:UDP-N-acetylenolpyruvoylglucosamine reductase